MMVSMVPPQPPAPPYDLPLNTTMQTVATLVLWAGTAALVIHGARMARSERSPFPLFLVLAVAAGSVIEPIYDITYHLHWLDAGEQWTLFTSFGLPQPVWVMPAYVMVFGLPALVLYRSLSENATMGRIFKLGALTTLTTAIFEITAINLDLYVYYGESPWRVFDYPLFIAFMEGAQITGFAVLCAVIRLKTTDVRHQLVVFALFPANFAYDVIGAGFPTLILQNSSPDPNGGLLFASAFVSVALAATALWWSGRLLLATQDAAADATRRPPVAARPAAPDAVTA
ncbi:hypothetical protein [Nocardioides daeguensis]|uniref:Spirocyclase, AveC family n=1 Tax=Nocardioides daeguensis TaxID=908359 RepID=A0ABP6UZG7_9ACTN|nr:hypothetical protein [Nocardioides daeguensis]MBV6728767.1 hypothetical protein [Nocardioides daeguensis]MCR1773623.1 hypothetical protein [Nocardioides daeguensis]